MQKKINNKQSAKRGSYKKAAKETKAEILAAVDATGNVSLVAKQIGTSESTIRGWLKGIGVDDEIRAIRAVKKEEIRDLHKLIVVKALGLLSTKLEFAKAGELATIAAISTDKMQLLGDEPTQITENRRDKKQIYEAYIEDKLKQAESNGETVTREQVIAKLKQVRPDVEQILELGGIG